MATCVYRWDEVTSGGSVVQHVCTRHTYQHECACGAACHGKVLSGAKLQAQPIEDLIEDAILHGLTQSDLARRLGVSSSAVNYHARRLGLTWSVRRR